MKKKRNDSAAAAMAFIMLFLFMAAPINTYAVEQADLSTQAGLEEWYALHDEDPLREYPENADGSDESNSEFQIMSSAGDIVSVAKSQVGVSGRPNTYTNWFGAIGESYSYPWCHVFVSWCASQAGVGDLIPNTARCTIGAEWFQDRGLWKDSSYTPSAGDIIYFDWPDVELKYNHVGIVDYVSGGRVYTIEGNSSDTVREKNYSLSYSCIEGYGTPRYSDSDTAPTNVSLSKNQVWYDIQDTIALTPNSDNATSYFLGVYNESGTCVVGQWITGTYEFSAASVGYGEYTAWVTACNSVAGTDSPAITFSVVGAAGYSHVWTDKKTFTMDETIWISVSTVCAKGQVIGIDKIGYGRVVTEQCDSSYGIEASKLGVGSYSAYFSVYNGSGGIDTSRITFEIINPVNYGDDFYAFIINNESRKMITNDFENVNVILKGEVPSDNQKWHFLRQSDGSYNIISLKDGKALDVYNASAESGTNVHMYESNGSNAQKWYLVEQYGNICLAPACSMCRLDIAGGVFEDGTNIQMYTNNNTSAQYFTVYVISDKAPQYARLYTDKDTYETGETVNFSARSDYATAFWMTVFNCDTKVRVLDCANIPSEYSMIINDPGEYRAWISAANGSGGMDSEKVYFTVTDAEDPTPTPTASPTATPTTSPTPTPTPTPAVTPTPPPAADGARVKLSSVTARAGETVDVTVELEDNKGFADLSVEVMYDSEVMTLVKAAGNPGVPAVYTAAQSLAARPYNMSWDSVSNVSFNGTLATLTFEIDGAAEAGEYPLSIGCYKGSGGNYVDGEDVNYDEEFNPLNPEYVSGVLRISDRVPGDINGDGRENSVDGTLLLRYLAGWSVTVDDSALDVNGDGCVNSKDGTVLLRHLAGWDITVH